MPRPPVLADMTPQAYRDLTQTARLAFAQRNWLEAARLYSKAVAAYPYDSRTWARLAASKTNLQDHAGAAVAYARAYEIGVPSYPENFAAEAARSYARAGLSSKAAAWLRTAIDKRYLQPQALLAETVFDQIRSDSEFATLSSAHSARPASNRVERWQADLDYFISEVKRVKQEPTAGGERAQRFLAAAAALRPGLATLSDSEVLVEMQKLIALFQESHNTAHFIYNPETVGAEPFKQMPLVFYVFPTGTYVIGADQAYEDLVGARVERFGDLSADEAVRRIGAIIDRDSDMTLLWLAPSLLSRTTVLHAIGASGSPDSAILKLTLRQGGTRDVRIDGGEVRPRAKLFPSRLSSRQPPVYLQRVPDAYWFTDLDEHTTYLQFNQVSRRAAAGETIDAFADRLAAHLDQKKPRTLIVDVRHNSGGDSYIYDRLLRTLIAFDFLPDTRLYLITGRNTYSAAINFAVDVDRLTDALVAGEPMGGMAVAGGDPMDVRLPYHGAVMGIASSVWARQSPWDTRAWIMVDLPVALTAADYFENRDPVLDGVLIDARQARQ